MIRWLFGMLLLNASFVYAQDNTFFHQPPPADTPQVFAPGIISDQYGNRDMAISPKGDELFYTVQYSRGLISVILYSHKINGEWASPVVASFSGLYNDLEPAFSSDGNKLFFVSNRPLQQTGAKKDYDIWFVTKQNGEWENATNAGVPVNSDKDEFFPSIAKNDNIYFTRAVGGREEDIMECKFTDGKYDDAKGLSDSVNSTFDEFNAFVDPGEQFIIFSSFGRKDDIGNGDLYISKNINGTWSKAVHLPEPINSTSLDYCPYISPDKKYFFFTSGRYSIKIPFTQQLNISSLHELLQNPLNGYDNIYWMKASSFLEMIK
ncbi:MAG: PD40 domain-containing protein [Parafilimonas sp.]|nr:PD40 domain-containing protein [Parafilimonas sp.]